MKYIKVSYKNHTKLYNIILFIISIGITLGLIISLSLDKELVNNIYNYFIHRINNYNKYTITNILYPIIVYLSIFIISLTLIGSFIPFLALFIENMSIGLILGVILRIKALKGLIFGFIYFTITKLIYLIILIYLSIKIFKFIRTFINLLRNKSDYSIYKLYSKILLRLFFSIISITMYNLLGIIIIPKIIKTLTFLI